MEVTMKTTTVIRYRMRADTADENQRLIEAVFAELAEGKPDGLHYAALRLDDGVSFVHIVSHDEDDADVLPTLGSFQKFLADFGDRVDGKPDRSDAGVVGSYRFLTP